MFTAFFGRWDNCSIGDGTMNQQQLEQRRYEIERELRWMEDNDEYEDDLREELRRINRQLKGK